MFHPPSTRVARRAWSPYIPKLFRHSFELSYLQKPTTITLSAFCSAGTKVYEEANRDITGWTGTDCSMPMCTQGFFDPFCTDLPQAPGGEVCARRYTSCEHSTQSCTIMTTHASVCTLSITPHDVSVIDYRKTDSPSSNASLPSEPPKLLNKSFQLERSLHSKPPLLC